MKKLLSVLLCLTFCLSAAALAETTGVQTVTSSSGLFTYDLPEDYLVITAETAQAIIDEYGVDGLTEDGFDASMIENLDCSTGDYACSRDFSSNVNVQITPESGLSQSMLGVLASTLDKSLIDTFVQVGISEEDCEPRGVEQVGDNTFYIFHVNTIGLSMDQYMTCNEAGTMFIITLTNIDEPTVNAIIESFKLIEE